MEGSCPLRKASKWDLDGDPHSRNFSVRVLGASGKQLPNQTIRWELLCEVSWARQLQIKDPHGVSLFSRVSCDNALLAEVTVNLHVGSDLRNETLGQDPSLPPESLPRLEGNCPLREASLWVSWALLGVCGKLLLGHGWRSVAGSVAFSRKLWRLRSAIASLRQAPRGPSLKNPWIFAASIGPSSGNLRNCTFGMALIWKVMRTLPSNLLWTWKIGMIS